MRLQLAVPPRFRRMLRAGLGSILGLSMFVATPAVSAIPDPSHSTCPAQITTTADGSLCFDVIVRDFLNNPAAGSFVAVNFGSSAIAFCPAQPHSGNTVSAVTNGLGVAHFCICATPPGAYPATITADGVLLCQPVAPQLRVDVVGESSIRANFPTAFDVVVDNLGSYDAVGVPLWITGIPTNATVGLGFTLTAPPSAGGEPDWSLVPDTLTSPGGRYLSLVIPRLPPGTTTRRIELTVPASVPSFSLAAAVAPPWADTLALASCLSNGGVIANPVCVRSQLTSLANYLWANPSVQALNGIGEWAKIGWACEGAGSLAAAIGKARNVLGYMVGVVETGTAAAGCGDVLLPRWRHVKPVTVVSSIDPNDKQGPTGTVSGQQAIGYTIHFENMGTAAAQQVRVTDVLASTLDLNTVNLDAINFGNTHLVPQPRLSQYSADVDLGATRGIIVRVTVGFTAPAAVTRELVWSFVSLDRTTGLPLPPSSLNGFLPPNLNPPEGEGSVLFSVKPSASAANGATIANQATIVFDGTADPTPTIENTLDKVAPPSHVLPLAASQTSGSFTVSWEPVGSPPTDLRDYTICVLENGVFLDPPWLMNTTTTTGTYSARAAGRTYSFYSIARDVSGNVEPIPPDPGFDTQTLATVAVEGGESPWPLRLDGARPNPARGPVQVWFSLPGPEPAVLELLDLAGRRVDRREVGSLGPGSHRVTLGTATSLRPGIYFLRLTQAGVEVRARTAVIR